MCPRTGQHMSSDNITDLYLIFEDALTDVLVENEYGLARTRLLEARARLKSHPDVTDSEYRKAVDRAFERYAQLKLRGIARER